MSLRSSLLSVLLLGACQTATPKTTTTPSPTLVVKVNEVAAALAPSVVLDPNDPGTCQVCHEQVVLEFRESLHARAHHSKDPVYGAMRAMRTVKQGDHVPAACANCHNSRDTTNHESAAAQAGVTCATCHQVSGVHATDGRKGIAALVVGPERLFRGPHNVPDGTSPVHANGPALPAIADGKTLCLACHGEEQNPAGIATCTTGPEYEASSDSRSCTSCHMPEVPGAAGAVTTRKTHRSHAFPGPHQQHRLATPGVLETAVRISGRFEGDAVVAVVENTSPHGFPTGFPARAAMLELRALDAAGKELGRNLGSDPMKDHPEAVFNRGYADAAGKPALAPFAVKQVRDARLKSRETREIKWATPVGTRQVEARLRFFLVAPFAAKQLGYDGPETRPIVLAPVKVTREEQP